MVNGHDIPEISFYENKNVFTGSEGNDFRYRIARVDTEEGKQLEASVWYEDICFELSNASLKEYFELSNEGLGNAVDWIFQQKK